MYVHKAQQLIVRHHKYSWALTLTALVFVFGIYFRQDAIDAATHTFTQDSWVGGAAVATSTHPGDQADWDQYESKTADIVANTTVSLLGTGVSVTDDIATSTTSTLTISGGGFNNGTLTSTATTSGGVVLGSLDTVAPMVASGNQGGEAAFILKSDGTVWQQGNIYNETTWGSVHPNVTLSNGDLTFTNFAGGWYGAKSILGKSSGKWYWEIAVTTSNNIGIGIATTAESVGDAYQLGDQAGSWSYQSDGTYNHAGGVPYGVSYGAGDVIGVALDVDAGEITMYVNGASQGVMATGLSGVLHPAVTTQHSEITANFGATTFTETPPLGFQGLTGYVKQPEQVSGISGVVSVAHGTDFVVALKSDGTVWQWDIGGTPAQVSGLGDIVQISSGGSFSLALKNDGTVWAWGHNNLGQRGDGGVASQFDAPAKVHGAGDVGFLEDIVVIGTANSTGYAVDSTGAVYAWGGNYSGQVGNGASGPSAHQYFPIEINITDVTQIIGGTYDGATYALKSDGTVWAWGANTYGEMGTGNNTPSLTPIEITSLADDDIVQISAGHTSGYALTSGGQIFSWGYNGQGQLGYGDTINTNTPAVIPTLSNVSYVAGDFLHAHALKSDGTLWSWGQNDYGQLGDGTLINSSVPVQSGVVTSFNTGTYNYASSGTFESSPLDFGAQVNVTTLDYDTTLNGQTISLGLRAGNSLPLSGSYTLISNGGDIGSFSGNRYFQYQAILSTTNTSFTPVLNSVTLNFTTYAPSGSLISNAYDTGDVTNHLSAVTWSETGTTTTQTIKFQVRSSPDGSTWSNWCGYADTGATCTGSNYFTSTENGVDLLASNPLRSGNDDQYLQYQTFLASGGGSAPYPLDDDGSVATAFNAGYAPAIAPDYVRSDYTYVSPSPGIGVAVTTPSLANLFTSQAINVGPGKKLAFEAIVHYVPDGGVDFDGLGIGVIESSGGSFVGTVTSFRLERNALVSGGAMRAVGVGVTDQPLIASEVGYRLGLEFDGDTGNVTYRTTDGTMGTAVDLFTPGNDIGLSLQYNDGGTTPAGKTASLEIVPSGSDMVLSYTAGSVDVGGNLLGASGTGTPLLTSVSLGYDFNLPPAFDPTFNTTGITATQETGGEVTITYKVLDTDTDLGTTTPGFITPSFEYSTDNGVIWASIPSGDMTPASLTDKAVATSTYTTHTATWNASTTSALFNTTEAQIRITADDNEALHNIATSTTANFTLITTPTTPPTVTTSGGGSVLVTTPPPVTPTPPVSTSTPPITPVSPTEPSPTPVTPTAPGETPVPPSEPTLPPQPTPEGGESLIIPTTSSPTPSPTFTSTTLSELLAIPVIKGLTTFTTLPGVKQTLDVSRTVIEDPLGNIVTKTVATAGVVSGAALAATSLFLNPLTIAELFLLPARIFAALLSALGIKKRSRRWGTVYDSVTKQPLDPAYVVLKDAQGNEVSTSITDLDGRYGFLIGPGTYTIEVNKTNYTFPSKKLQGLSKDILYDDLYFGEPFTLLDSSPLITKNIPLDPTTFDWNEFTKQEKSLTTFKADKETKFQTIATYSLYLGLPIAIIGVLIAPAPYNAIIMGAYIILGALRILGFKPKAHGQLKDNQGNPLSYAIVRVHDVNQNNKEIFHRVADALGRYYCLVQKGTYTITVEQKNPDETYTLVYTSKPITTEKGVIKDDIKL